MQTPVTSSEARSRRLQVQERVVGDARDRLILSTAFSVLSMPAVQPLIRLKQMTQCVPEYQLQRKPVAFKTGFGAALHIWRNEGFRRYWRGVVPAMAFTLPTMYAKHLSTLNFAQDLNNSPSVAGSIWRGAAVALVYSTAVSIFNALDMVSTKMATDLRFPEHITIAPQKENLKNVLKDAVSSADQKVSPNATAAAKQPSVTYTPYKFRNSIFTLKKIYHLNGFQKLGHAVLPLYLHAIGHFTTIFVISAFAAATGMDSFAPTLTTLGISAFSTALLHPLDTIRTRMFYRLPTTTEYRIKPYTNMLECAKYIWDHEGTKGFYRGWGNSVNIFAMSIFTSALATSILNAARRERLKNDYMHKVREYAAEDRLRQLHQNRATVDSLIKDDDYNSFVPRD